MIKDKFHKYFKDFRQEEFNTLSYSFEDSPNCLLTTKTELGPYYIENTPDRINIKEDQKGIGLFLGLKIVNMKDCTNIHKARVELWQANAEGEYSGFDLGKVTETPTNSKRWLRGYQESDYLGFVEFETIYPGKYRNRTNHLHLKISYQGQEKLITQLFFPQNINDYISTLSPYNLNPALVTNYNDPVIRSNQGCKGCWPKVSPFGSRYIATLTIGLD